MISGDPETKQSDCQLSEASLETPARVGNAAAGQAPRKPYSKPQLRLHGTVAELTAGRLGTRADARNNRRR